MSNKMWKIFFGLSQNIQTLITKLIYGFFSVSFKKKRKKEKTTVVCCIYCYIIKTMHFEHIQGLFFVVFCNFFAVQNSCSLAFLSKTLNSFKFYSVVSKLLKTYYLGLLLYFVIDKGQIISGYFFLPTKEWSNQINKGTFLY